MQWATFLVVRSCMLGRIHVCVPFVLIKGDKSHRFFTVEVFLIFAVININPPPVNINRRLPITLSEF